jgi:ubiquitin-like modifier-activating enzyme ATG7
MKDQTLDQQCTVTRPGVAAIASALAVELLVSILQHPDKHHAAAPVPVVNANTTGSLTTYDRDPPDHPLGVVPHQIRGFLSSYQNLLINGRAYPQCSACSAPILEAYNDKAGTWAFVRKALEERDWVAEISGLAEVQRQAEEAASGLDWSDDEEGGDGAADGDGVMVDA